MYRNKSFSTGRRRLLLQGGVHTPHGTAPDGNAGSLEARYRTIPDDAVRYRSERSDAVRCVM